MTGQMIALDGGQHLGWAQSRYSDVVGIANGHHRPGQ